MKNRREILVTGGSLIAAPYFFIPTIVKADALTDGLVQEIGRVTDNLAMRPAGPQDGRDLQVAGGGTIFGRSVTNQAQVMADHGRFTEVHSASSETREVSSNGQGYLFARFRQNFRNCCLPLGFIPSQNGHSYGGAMTLIEAPNLVGLRVLTDLLKARSYTAEQISDLCWPVRPCNDGIVRQRAFITFDAVSRMKDARNNDVYLDRDVLLATSATCTLRYTHQNGVPDGGGEGALIVAGQEQFRYEFKYDRETLRS